MSRMIRRKQRAYDQGRRDYEQFSHGIYRKTPHQTEYLLGVNDALYEKPKRKIGHV